MTSWLLLHGTPLTPRIWDPVAACLGGAVVVPDLTRVPAPPEAQAAMADAVVSSLDGTEDYDVVGHSFGGQIALEAALLLGDRLRSLTIACSRDTPFPGFGTLATAVRAGAVPSVDASLERWFTPDDLSADGAVVRQTRADLAGVSLPDWANALEAIADFDRSASVGAIRAPTRLIAAGLDRVSTPEVMAAFAARLPDGSLIVRDAWAHMSPFVDPEAFAALLTNA